jgi:hypothetical protein
MQLGRLAVFLFPHAGAFKHPLGRVVGYSRKCPLRAGRGSQGPENGITGMCAGHSGDLARHRWAGHFDV